MYSQAHISVSIPPVLSDELLKCLTDIVFSKLFSFERRPTSSWREKGARYRASLLGGQAHGHGAILSFSPS